MTTQLLLYLIAGSLVTGIDVLVYNLLAGAPFRLRRVPAHLISTAFAMLAGFTLHFALVFRPAEPELLARIMKYVLTVCFSAYLLQTSVISALSSLWRAPAQWLGNLAAHCGRVRIATADMVERNFVKACAIGTGLAFNFVSFKFFVYAL